MDLTVHLRDLVPQPTDLLELEAEELAGILLAAIQRSGHTQVSRHNTMLAISSNTPQIFDVRVARELPPVLAEAWAWLERECLLIVKPTDPHWQVLSRRAKRITTPADFEIYRGASSFPRSLLHPRIEKEAWPSFSRGRFDTALFEAFREVEIAVRDAAGFPQHDHGVAMVRRAFHKETGPLTDRSVDDGEREATSNLFAGAIGSYKNPNSHRHVGRDDVAEAGELLVLAGHLLRVVEQRDQRSPKNRLAGHERTDGSADH
jgi:uncharacterized protein (TIGR02391 family)